MASVVRWIALPVLLFSAIVPASVCAEDPAAGKPRVLVTISEETTYITEPLRADGYPDYVAALNERCSEGVTPENNSAVLFWKAMGPSSIEEKDREKYFEMLGIPPLPDEGDYFVTSDEWIERQKARENPDQEQTEWDYIDPLWEQQSEITKRPWSKEEFPVWAEWLEVNEKPLALLMEASRRPKRYDPMLGKTVIMSLLPAAQGHRDVARALVARAMLRVHEGKVDEAWEDLLACHRLGRLVGQGATLIDILVGITLDGMACAGDQTLLQHARLTAAQAAKMQDDLSRLPSMPKLADKMELGERFMGLDIVSMVAREGPASLWKLTDVEPGGMAETLVDSVHAAALDWDIMLRMLNSWYDRMADAASQPTRSERQEAMDRIDKDLRKLQNTAKDWMSLGLSMLANPRKVISERFGETFVVLFLPALSACTNAEDRSAMQFELTKLAFTLAAYRADHGSYPAKLDDLKPKYISEVPKDIFNDAALHYQREGDGYVLYSVGINRKDDGGKGYEDLKEFNEGWDDLVVRMPAVMNREAKRRRPEIIAHRGESSLAPENTSAAVELAWAGDADAVEIDVRLTADGHLIVCHDEDTERTTGRKLVIGESTLAELRQLDAGAWKGTQWAGQKIPLLTKILNTVLENKRLFVEVKVGLEAVPALKEAVEKSGKRPEQVVVISFQPSVIAEAKRRMPRHRAFLVVGFQQDEQTGVWSPGVEEIIAEARAVQADGVDLSARPPLNGPCIEKLREAGLEVYAWTVDSAEDARRLIEFGAAGITTNRSCWMKQELADGKE